MKKRFALPAVLVAIGAFVVVAGASAIASHNSQSEHWGVVARNTIGSPVAALRTGPFGSFGVTDAPPFGKGSLGIETAAVPGFVEKVDFGNEVDFFEDNVLALTSVGFHVFQTGENVTAGGSRNLPNIRMEIDPNLNTNPTNFSTMVWNPPAVPANKINRWSDFIDATTTGDWFLTGSAGVTTGCNQVTTCTFTQLKTALNDGPPSDVPSIFSVNVGKGRDNVWAGAVDGLRINNRVIDFEADQVRDRGGNRDDD
jgi:hypothetical protein